MMTVAVTLEECGQWIPFEQIQGKRPPSPKGWLVHSIKFDDGRVWDAYNGWRGVENLGSELKAIDR